MFLYYSITFFLCSCFLPRLIPDIIHPFKSKVKHFLFFLKETSKVTKVSAVCFTASLLHTQTRVFPHPGSLMIKQTSAKWEGITSCNDCTYPKITTNARR